MDNQKIIAILGLIVIGAGLVYIGLISVPHQLTTFEKYKYAPACNNEIPSEPGICKWSDTVWLVCENESSLIYGEILNCTEVSSFDVQT